MSEITDVVSEILQEKENKLIDALNKMLSACDPIVYEDFNKTIKANDNEKLGNLEKEIPEIGIVEVGESFGITTLSLIATITDLLVGKRLGFVIDVDGEGKHVLTKAVLIEQE